MGKPLIECVPNFSEGRDLTVIKQITDAIESVEGISLLDVDPGQATNRTVVTFVGEPEAVVEAAVRAGRKAYELIDMSKHKGAHPRFGAMDVCPLVPVADITMEQVVPHARRVGQRLADEVGVSGYYYEYAATCEERRNLAAVRAGEYEGLPEKLADPRWKPDFGPARFNPKYGVTAVGAREFLVAYNVNLNTKSKDRANEVAMEVREQGRPKRDPVTGNVLRDEKGERIMIPGTLKCVKGIGWYIQEYGIAQVSMNLTNLSVTPVHVAFEECRRVAREKGLRVTGSELVGLIPLKAMLEAGRYYLKKQRRSCGVSDRELVTIAIKSLGLNDLYQFKPEEKIIEYAIADKKRRKLVDLSVRDFVEETASESPAPGGGSVSAAAGAMGAALGTMVANLSAAKKGKEWEERWEEFSNWAERGKAAHAELLRLIDDDTDAFNKIMAAFGLPKGTDEEQAARSAAIQAATREAILVPLRVMEVSLEAMEVAKAMAESGLPASVSDAGCAALACRTAVLGAHLNVKINAVQVTDRAWAEDILARSRQIEERAVALEGEILEVVNRKIAPSAG